MGQGQGSCRLAGGAGLRPEMKGWRDAGIEGAHREQRTVSLRAGTGSMATPAQTWSSTQPCAPPPRLPPPRLPLRLVLRQLLPGLGDPLPGSPPSQHRRCLHDRPSPPATRAARSPAPTANRRPGPAPAAALSQWRVSSAAVGGGQVPARTALCRLRAWNGDLNNRSEGAGPCRGGVLWAGSGRKAWPRGSQGFRNVQKGPPSSTVSCRDLFPVN